MSEDNYGADSIQSLEGLEAVRKRSAMYIGGTGKDGLHHLVNEVIDNSIDEAMAGNCDKITVTILEDDKISVEDNGRGIPVEYKEEKGKTALEQVMTELHAGGKFDNKAYKASGGLHGVGISVVNALSENLEVQVKRNGKIHQQEYSKGEITSEIEEIGETSETGTKITFQPDDEIFENTVFDYEVLENRVRELSFLNKGVKMVIEDKRDSNGKKEVFEESGGLEEFAEYLNYSKEPLHEPIKLEGSENNIEVEIVIQYTTSVQESIHSYVNNINTRDGTHVTGFKRALTRIIGDFAEELRGEETKDRITGDDIREGITSIISVKHPDPQFQGQTKTELGNKDASKVVSGVVYDDLKPFLKRNSDIAEKIVEKCDQAAKSRIAAEKARMLKKEEDPQNKYNMPNKLADCRTRDPEKAELFIAEGDSAGGCFTGDTEVAIPSGKSISLKKLVEEYKEGKEYNCYTVDEQGFIRIGKIENPRLTKENAKLVEIELDDGEVIECTSDHEFMLKSGKYEKAENLKNGDSLMPLYRGISENGEEITNCYGTVEKLPSRNHFVWDVREKEKTEDVYDIEVPGTHNFALEKGVFVHNSAKQARDPEYQAILPLKGKIMNAEKNRLDRILKNNEIQSIITAIGTGIGEQFDIENCRYNKIIIACDADVDGKHIRTLILTLFYRHMKPLIEEGKVYFAKPPLFRIKYNGETYDAMTKEEKEEIIQDKCNGNPETVKRFKGLGEMNPDQLWDAIMNPDTRTLRQIRINDESESDRNFSILMGSKVKPRRDFIQENFRQEEVIE